MTFLTQLHPEEFILPECDLRTEPSDEECLQIIEMLLDI
jgi:hypothetical protein